MRAVLLAVLAVSTLAQVPLESYRVENVPLPRDIAPEVAGVADPVGLVT